MFVASPHSQLRYLVLTFSPTLRVDTDVKEWEGLPIGIQLFTLPHQEEKALAIASVVDKLIKGQ